MNAGQGLVFGLLFGVLVWAAFIGIVWVWLAA